MDSEIDIDRGALEEQPLTPDEKNLLSDYFQMEGRRQFENFRSLLMFQEGRSPGLFEMMNLPGDFLQELSDKKLSLELSQREHWINLMSSIHEQFFQRKPARPEILLWTLISLEKHAIVKIETGKEEYRKVLNDVQNQQLPLIGKLGEQRSRDFTQNLNLFYQLLNIDGLSHNLIGLY